MEEEKDVQAQVEEGGAEAPAEEETPAEEEAVADEPTDADVDLENRVKTAFGVTHLDHPMPNNTPASAVFNFVKAELERSKN